MKSKKSLQIQTFSDLIGVGGDEEFSKVSMYLIIASVGLQGMLKLTTVTKSNSLSSYRFSSAEQDM